MPCVLHTERLNFDNQDLDAIPILKGESQLRLLNFQHNQIRRIQHVSHLRSLIFLDLYDNHITHIAGLESARSLRVRHATPHAQSAPFLSWCISWRRVSACASDARVGSWKEHKLVAWPPFVAV